MISCSANELESLVRRAARGAGMAWGLAEEAGKSVRWLDLRCIASVGLMRVHLEAYAGKPFSEVAPDTSGDIWTAPGGKLCPVAAGSAVSDLLDATQDGAEITLGATSCPALLSGIVGRSAEAANRLVSVVWGDETLVLCGAGPDCAGMGKATLAAADADTITVRFGVSPIDAPKGMPPGMGALSVPKADWDALKKLALKTYVPETEESRLSGAGAGLTDND